MKLNIADQIETPSPMQLWEEYEKLIFPEDLEENPTLRIFCQLAFMGGIEALFKVIDLVVATRVNDPTFRAKVLETYRVLNKQSFDELVKKVVESDPPEL